MIRDPAATSKDSIPTMMPMIAIVNIALSLLGGGLLIIGI